MIQSRHLTVPVIAQCEGGHMTLFEPRRVYLDLTRACNLSCLHCYADAGKPREDELTLSELQGVASQMASLGVPELIVSGGEPLLRPDLLPFLQFCRGLGLDTTVLTNGLLLDGPTVRVMREAAVKVRLSLDGIREETNDVVRGKGTLRRIRQAIRLVQSEGHGSALSVHFTVHRVNIQDILGVPAFLRELGVNELVMSTIKATGRARQNRHLLIEPTLMPYVRQKMWMVQQNRELRRPTHPEEGWRGVACPAGQTKMGITSNGRVTPCVFLGPGLEGQSVREQSLGALWRQDLSMQRLRGVEAKPSSGCGGCPVVGSNHGGCRARALHFSGSLDGTDPYCCNARDHARTASASIMHVVQLVLGPSSSSVSESLS